MPKFLTGLAGRLIAIALVVPLIIFGVTQCQNARVASKKAGISADQTEALGQSAADAIGTVGDVAGRSTDSDDLTRENSDAISNAEGADAPVHPDVRDAGLVAICRRVAYTNDPRCKVIPHVQSN